MQALPYGYDKEHTELKDLNDHLSARDSSGIPAELPPRRTVGTEVNRAPKRKDILSAGEKRLALENALRYFPKEWHAELAPEFLEELKEFGRIYMYRFKPSYDMHAVGLKIIRARRLRRRPSC